MQVISNRQDLDTLVQNAPIVIVEIGSIRCCACSAISQKLAAYCDHTPNVIGCTLSLESAADICAALGIYSAPAVLVYACGHLTIREAGAMSIEDIIRRIERYREMVEGEK